MPPCPPDSLRITHDHRRPARPRPRLHALPDVPVPHAPTGPLAGLSFGVKDLFHVAGYPTSGGNPLVLAHVGIKTRTAPTVQKLLDAGARFAGKTSPTNSRSR
jgi:Asp-tRNA(Asn)/Glu-tRNA(Gln) amidotransferase A subunit family amidase